MKLLPGLLIPFVLLCAGCASPESYYNPPQAIDGNASLRGCRIDGKETGTVAVYVMFIDGLIARGGTARSDHKVIYPITPGKHTIEFYIARFNWIGAPFTKRLATTFEAEANKEYQTQIELTDPETMKKPSTKAVLWLADVKTGEPVTQKLEFITDGVPHVMY